MAIRQSNIANTSLVKQSVSAVDTGATSINVTSTGNTIEQPAPSTYSPVNQRINVNLELNLPIAQPDTLGAIKPDNSTITVDPDTGIATAIASSPIRLPLSIVDGGTGQQTAQEAINNLLPSQENKEGKYLTTNGINILWSDIPMVDNTKINAIQFTPIMFSGAFSGSNDDIWTNIKDSLNDGDNVVKITFQNLVQNLASTDVNIHFSKSDFMATANIFKFAKFLQDNIRSVATSIPVLWMFDDFSVEWINDKKQFRLCTNSSAIFIQCDLPDINYPLNEVFKFTALSGARIINYND